MHFLCSTLLFMVLFSSGTENSGYLGAMIAVCLWYIGTPTRKTTPVLNTVLFVFCFILTSLSPTDIFPCYIRKTYVIPYALKALPCVLIWFKIVWEQLTLDFQSRFIGRRLSRVKRRRSTLSCLVITHKKAGNV